MQFRIAETFTDALARLPAQEQKAAKTSAFDLQLDPASPGLQFHRIDKSKDRNFWSIRVNRDLRIIVHKTADSVLLAYVDHHDKAYAWAERRRIEAHPKTGAIQIVEVRERVEEIASRLPFEPLASEPIAGTLPAKPRCFDLLSREELLSVGVPADWIDDVLDADEDRFLTLADHLPEEASEALLEFVSTGALPPHVALEMDVAKSVAAPLPPRHFQRVSLESSFDHPDTLRRITPIANAEELEIALAYPWEKWLVYLHPSQRDVVEKKFTGPARIAGSAGTGKTVVALHRAARLAKQSPEARVLLTTFSEPLARMLSRKLKLLTGETGAVAPRVTVAAFHGIANELYQLIHGRRPAIASAELVRSLLKKAAETNGASDVALRFLVSEWTHVIDAWQLASEEAYANVPRLGRKNRLGAKQRMRLWPVFAATRATLAQKGMTTRPQILAELSAHYSAREQNPFTHIVVDEAQDLGVAELRFLAALASREPDALFFAGDLGQRIFQQPFSWLMLGVDIRGRSQTLKVNYRTSHQIREAADRLLPQVLRDVDGLEERRSGTVSAFNGPAPVVTRFDSAGAESIGVGEWITNALADGFHPSEIAVFVRDHDQIDRAREAVGLGGGEAFVLSERDEEPGLRIAIGTMHLAKGLEFKAVAVMACDDDVLPLQSRIDAVADEVELDDVYETERQLLYVACTRARDRLFVSGVAPASEFLNDMNEGKTF